MDKNKDMFLEFNQKYLNKKRPAKSFKKYLKLILKGELVLEGVEANLKTSSNIASIVDLMYDYSEIDFTKLNESWCRKKCDKYLDTKQVSEELNEMFYKYLHIEEANYLCNVKTSSVIFAKNKNKSNDIDALKIELAYEIGPTLDNPELAKNALGVYARLKEIMRNKHTLDKNILFKIIKMESCLKSRFKFNQFDLDKITTKNYNMPVDDISYTLISIFEGVNVRNNYVSEISDMDSFLKRRMDKIIDDIKNPKPKTASVTYEGFSDYDLNKMMTEAYEKTYKVENSSDYLEKLDTYKCYQYEHELESICDKEYLVIKEDISLNNSKKIEKYSPILLRYYKENGSLVEKKVLRMAKYKCHMDIYKEVLENSIQSVNLTNDEINLTDEERKELINSRREEMREVCYKLESERYLDFYGIDEAELARQEVLKERIEDFQKGISFISKNVNCSIIDNTTSVNTDEVLKQE